MKACALALLLLALATATAARAAPNARPTARKATASMPRTKRLTPAEIERAAREAMAATPPRLPKDAAVTGVRCATTPEVPAAPSRVTIEVARVPRRAGLVAVPAVLTFHTPAALSARVPVTIELDVPPGSLVPDVAIGSTVTLVVERGLVEITTPAVTSSGGDVGDVVQVILKPSGRALRAKLVAKDRAVAEGGR
jgi:hypothetical protein